MKTKYILELTDEEALMLVYLARSSSGDSRVARAVLAVGDALIDADPRLDDRQFAIYERGDQQQSYDLSAGPQIEPRVEPWATRA